MYVEAIIFSSAWGYHSGKVGNSLTNYLYFKIVINTQLSLGEE